MIELDCPGCGHALRIQNKYAGLKGKCKYCETSFKVPFDIVLTPGQGQEVVNGDSDGETGVGLIGGLDDRAHLPFGREDMVEEVSAPRERRPPGKSRPSGDFGEDADVVASSQPGIVVDARKRNRVDEVRLVDPGADRIGAVRYGRRGGGLFVPLVASCVIVLSLFGVAFWMMGRSDGEDELSTSIDRGVAGALRAYDTVRLAGVDVAVFGAGNFVEGDFEVPRSDSLGGIGKKGLLGYTAVVVGEYSVVVSDYQLALTELGWDFVIADSGDSTELWGEFDGKDVSLVIEGGADGVRAVLVTVKD